MTCYREYWAIRSSVYSFARTAHSFACSALLASLARSAALIRSLARSLTHSGAHGEEVFVYELNASISYHLRPLCTDRDANSMPSHIKNSVYTNQWFTSQKQVSRASWTPDAKRATRVSGCVSKGAVTSAAITPSVVKAGGFDGWEGMNGCKAIT